MKRRVKLTFPQQLIKARHVASQGAPQIGVLQYQQHLVVKYEFVRYCGERSCLLFGCFLV